MTDQFIGNYKVLKKIGAGGMAQVFLAVHKDVPNLKVVLKILSDARLAERFRQEADKLALLDGHSSVCQIKHFFNHGDEFVIAMEFIDGATLEDLIKRDGKMPLQDSLKIISDVLSTLEFAHQKDIFHRDIKPGNIMVDARGQVKIIDFGIAKSKTDPNLTIAGTSCGTPAYMPPEQFNPSENIDYALVDVYAVGTTLFYMLTGDLPFKGDNQFALRDAKLFNDPAKPRDINPDIPKAVEEVILKALAKDPEDRYSSAAEMQAAIDGLRKDTGPVQVSAAVKPATTKIKTPPPDKKSSSKIIPIAAVVVVILAVAGYFIFSGGSKPKVPGTPELISPANGATVETDLPDFNWRALDRNDISYILEYAADSTFASPIERQVVLATNYTPAEPLPNGSYFWRVQAQDREGNKGPLSAWRMFIVDVAAVEAAKPEGTLSLTVRPDGDIYIDNKLIGEGKSEAEVKLDTGWHDIKIVNQASTQKTRTDRVYLSEGGSESRSFTFTFPPPTPKADSGEVAIGSLPTDGGAIFIDGKLQDLQTNNTFRLPAGRHIIKVVLNVDGQEMEKTDSVQVVRGETQRKLFNFEK